MYQPLLECVGITKTFDDTQVLHEINLQVGNGQFVTLLGPSGCGKTTTLRIIAGFEQIDSGVIRLKNQIIDDSKQHIPPEKRNIGMVFQDYALFPHLNVEQNIAFGLKGSKQDKQKRVQELLELVGLGEFVERMPYELSGGQQQRVALARALAPEPQMILLDEPFSNLDTALRAQVRSEVYSILKKAETTTIFVTHDQQEALSLSDKIAVIFDGRVAQMDTPYQIYNRPTSLEVANFIGDANILPAMAEDNIADTILGKLVLAQPRNGNVNLLIRPEDVRIVTDEAGVGAQVFWREYYGHTQQLGLQLEDGTKLTARTDPNIIYHRGQHIRIEVSVAVMAFE